MFLPTYTFEGHIKAVQPLSTCSKDLSDREGKRNAPTPVPWTQTEQGKRLMFPASGIRGALRRACRDVVRDYVIEQSGDTTPFDLDTHYLNTLGGIKGSGEEDKTSITRINAVREKNPLLNIFGAGDAGTVGFVAGRIGIGNAICHDISEPVIFSGARSDDFYRSPDQVQFLSDLDIAILTQQSSGNREISRLKSQERLLKRRIAEALSKDDQQALEQARGEITDIETRIQAIREDTGTNNSVGMPLAGWQAIPQGAEMSHRITLRRATHVDLGLLLATLNAFSLDPILGAHYATGNGLVSAHWKIHKVTRKGKALIGSIDLHPFDLATVVPSDDATELSEAQAAFDAFMAKGEWDFSVPEKV